MAGYPNNQGSTLSTGASLTDEGDEELLGAMKRLSQRHSLSKLSLLLKLIDRAFKAAGQVPPAGQAHRDELELWADVLEKVPELRLAGDYLTAEGARRNGYHVAPLDVLAVYNRDQAEDLGDADVRKAAGWRALADSDGEAGERYVRPMTPCDYPGCETPCCSRYCMVHGDLQRDRRMGVLRPEFEEANEKA